MFSDDPEKSCNNVWSSADGGVGWTIIKETDTKCIITGEISQVI